jgi:hypothetical protein
MKKKFDSYFSDVTVGDFTMQYENIYKDRTGKTLIVENAVASTFFSGSRKSFGKLSRIYNFNARYWRFGGLWRFQPTMQGVGLVCPSSDESPGFNYGAYDEYLRGGIQYTDIDYVVANNAALALELHLKDFILQAFWLDLTDRQWGSVLPVAHIPATHDLLKLFECIPSSQIQIIEDLFLQWRHAFPENLLAIKGVSICELLQEINSIQISARYGDEIIDLRERSGLSVELSTFLLYKMPELRRAHFLGRPG